MNRKAIETLQKLPRVDSQGCQIFYSVLYSNSSDGTALLGDEMFLTINDDGTRNIETSTYTFTPIKGMEGPNIYRNSDLIGPDCSQRVLHYCPKVGKYYDQSQDFFIEIGV